MILLFSDFTERGPYVGEMEVVCRRLAPGVPVVRLMSDAVPFRPDLASPLLAALARRFQPGDVCVAVVDPGVGTERAPLALELDGIWFVGPDNGLFEHVRREALEQRAFRITRRPPRLSTSFHGRDLFAPAAARIAQGDLGGLEPCEPSSEDDWPDDPSVVVYVDGFGNLITGIRGEVMPREAELVAGGRRLRFAETFGRVPAGEAFWYVNSMGLVEIAVNGGSAAQVLGLGPGDAIIAPELESLEPDGEEDDDLDEDSGFD